MVRLSIVHLPRGMQSKVAEHTLPEGSASTASPETAEQAPDASLPRRDA